MEGRFKREGTYVYLWLIHGDVWQKLTQFSKAIILQLKMSESWAVVSNSLYLWTIQSMEFSRPEHWSIFFLDTGISPSPVDLPNPGIELRSPALKVDSLPTEPKGKPQFKNKYI